MGRIRIQNGAEVPLRTHHLIGRSRAMHSTIRSPDVSAQHLSIGWDGQRWRARDLASRNGTRLDGELLRSGEDAALKAGSVLELGSPDIAVVITDDGPPAVIARCGDTLLEGDGTFLALPSSEDPEAVVLLDPDEGWSITRDEEWERVEDGQTVTVADEEWTLTLPETLDRTTDVRATQAPKGLALQFGVSSDEEYVEVTVVDGERTIKLPPRAHHYVLLTLARIRQQDTDASEAEQGWTYRDVLRREVQMSSNQLYVSVHRLRKEFEKAGLLSGTQLIEQRKTTRQVRLGVKLFTIRSL